MPNLCFFCQDLKSANILLTRDGAAKIADVGLAKIMSRELTQVSARGSFDWVAPEVILSVFIYTWVADIQQARIAGSGRQPCTGFRLKPEADLVLQPEQVVNMETGNLKPFCRSCKELRSMTEQTYGGKPQDCNVLFRT